MAGHIEKLFARLDPDDALEIADHHRERVRTEDGADAVDRVVVFFAVRFKRRVDGLLERLQPVGDFDDVRAEDLHPCDVGRLLLDIDRAHVDVAFQTEIRRGSGEGDAVLTGACLGDHLFLAHVFGEQGLAHAVVELMRAGMVEIFAFRVKLPAAAHRVREPFEMGNRRRPSLKLRADAAQLGDELARLTDAVIRLRDLRHRGFQLVIDKDAAVAAEVAVLIRIMVEIRVKINAVKLHISTLQF